MQPEARKQASGGLSPEQSNIGVVSTTLFTIKENVFFSETAQKGDNS